ncbi:hypothetical protein ACFE04_016469 [Oxalis oulophora]
MKNLLIASATTSTVTVPTKKRTKRTTTATATTLTTATGTTATIATATATTATVPTRKRTKKITSATATTTTATTTAQRSFAHSSGPTRMEAVRNSYNDPSVLTSKSDQSVSSPTQSSQLGISLMKQKMAGHDDFDDIDNQNNPRPVKKKKSMGPNLQTQESRNTLVGFVQFPNYDGILLLQSLAYSESQLVKCVATI